LENQGGRFDIVIKNKATHPDQITIILFLEQETCQTT